MKKSAVTSLVVLTVFLIVLSGECIAQSGGVLSPGAGMYDPDTLQNVMGVVVKMVSFDPGSLSQGIQIILQTEGEAVLVNLGPSWYISKQGFKFETGDKLRVRGSRVIYNTKPAIIATMVMKGNDILQLRDEKTGVPLWRGQN